MYFVDMMTIRLHTPFMVNITSDLCAPGRDPPFELGQAAFLWKIHYAGRMIGNSVMLFECIEVCVSY